MQALFPAFFNRATGFPSQSRLARCAAEFGEPLVRPSELPRVNPHLTVSGQHFLLGLIHIKWLPLQVRKLAGAILCVYDYGWRYLG